MSYINQKLEDFKKSIKNKKIAIIGLGVSNIPLIEYLYKLSTNITVFDKREEKLIDNLGIEKIKEYNIKLITGKDNLESLKGFDIIFRSPSCRPDLPEIQAEIGRGAILTSEIEMLIELCPGTVVGVTGSDGKTTTTSLIYNIIKQKGYNCYLGGNIGIPLFTKIDEMKPEDIIVLELSSFQLMNMKKSPNISVITNISPNHLDIHKSYDEYIEAKANIFKYQTESDILITNFDNEITKKLSKQAPGKIVYFSSKEKLEDGVILDDNTIKICEDGLRRHVLKVEDILLRGKHNYENICTAIAATLTLADVDTQIKVIENFKGVEHRLEFVKEIDGIKWYNDSIGSSPSRTIAGLNSFSEKIVLIAGGYDKHLDYTPIAEPIINNVSKLILLGQTADKIETAVKNKLQGEKLLSIYRTNSLKEAVETAKKVAIKGEVVLFSPASASFDMFKNFEERGNKFKEIISKI